ncbi:hypothetical protein HHK36_017313 [Tetracentron sinense]|uniref:Uncharacterized protein n=1 Tax=Tetracentron sinense TaxID=13715 RepID=A0A835DCQ8_TETSI|nr:hypothetical protein HHK36_017313 [Tetracentron sinense]
MRSIQTIAERKSPLSSNSMKQNPKTQLPIQPNTPSIYKVPANMRRVERKAYDPNIISIIPYHRGLTQLQAMEEIKKKFLHCLLDPIREQGVPFDTLFHAMKGLEEKAISCYSETLNIGSDKFGETLLVDGCFIIELFRDSIQHKTAYTPIFTPRWMLPILRRDLIMLESQIPWFVLSTLFELTHSSVTPNYTTHDQHSFIDLALQFFNPLMPRDPETMNQSIAVAQSSGGVEHLLGLFRSSFLPSSIILRGKQPHMIRSVKDLQEAGVKLEKRENHFILDLSFTEGVMRIPPLLMEDYTGTLFRNLVAYEQCHPPCKPDFTSYLFFIDGLKFGGGCRAPPLCRDHPAFAR